MIAEPKSILSPSPQQNSLMNKKEPEPAGKHLDCHFIAIAKQRKMKSLRLLLVRYLAIEAENEMFWADDESE